MKKIYLRSFFVFFLTFIIIWAMLFCNASAKAEGTFSWYCKRTKDHSQPPLPTEFEIILENEGYYIGKDQTEKVVYLTFDAGYENGNVEKTLDILKKNDVKGAFFILSNLINTNVELVLRMADEGHLVCNHTATHKDMSKIDAFEDFEKEIINLEKLYYERTGREVSKYFRPPEGRFSEKTLQFANRIGYKTVFWSFAYEDWNNDRQMTPEAAKKKILENVHNGEVMLLHPTSATNVQVLDDVIKELKKMGYRFGTLDELTTNE